MIDWKSIKELHVNKKLEQIRGNAYLSYALGKLSRIESPLVIYGHALGRSDSHIADAIVGNEKIKALYVGLFGDPLDDFIDILRWIRKSFRNGKGDITDKRKYQ